MNHTHADAPPPDSVDGCLERLLPFIGVGSILFCLGIAWLSSRI